MKIKYFFKLTNLVLILVLIITTGGLFLFPSTSEAVNFTEDFSTTTYKDSANTTADWDTTAGKLRLPQAVGGWSLAYDSPEIYIASLCSYKNKLYAGTFENGMIYVYDGSSWNISFDSPYREIRALAVYNGKLYAGSGSGSYSGDGIIYVFDGTSWSQAYDTDDFNVFSLGTYNNKLYAGTGDGSGSIYVYDGTSWSLSYDSPEYSVFCLGAYKDKLYAGTQIGGKIYQYDGTSWSLAFDAPDYSGQESAMSLTVYGNKLYLYAGTGGAWGGDGRIYVFDGSSWSEAYNTGGGDIYSVVYNNKLYVSNASTNGKVWSYDGTSWTETVYSNLIGNGIISWAVYNGRLYAGTYPDGMIYVYEENTYQSTGQAQSTNINPTPANVSSATLTAIENLNGQTINYFLSNNGGATWEQVAPGVGHNFTNPGKDLRWKVVLETTNLAVTPEIDSLTIDYFSHPTLPPAGLPAGLSKAFSTIVPSYKYGTNEAEGAYDSSTTWYGVNCRSKTYHSDYVNWMHLAAVYGGYYGYKYWENGVEKVKHIRFVEVGWVVDKEWDWPFYNKGRSGYTGTAAYYMCWMIKGVEYGPSVIPLNQYYAGANSWHFYWTRNYSSNKWIAGVDNTCFWRNMDIGACSGWSSCDAEKHQEYWPWSPVECNYAYFNYNKKYYDRKGNLSYWYKINRDTYITNADTNYEPYKYGSDNTACLVWNSKLPGWNILY